MEHVLSFYLLSENVAVPSISEMIVSMFIKCGQIKFGLDDGKSYLIILQKMKAERREDQAVGSPQHFFLIKTGHKAAKKITMKHRHRRSVTSSDIDKSLDLEKFSKRNDPDFSLSLARS